jgi:hypothetical protein
LESKRLADTGRAARMYDGMIKVTNDNILKYTNESQKHATKIKECFKKGDQRTAKTYFLLMKMADKNVENCNNAHLQLQIHRATLERQFHQKNMIQGLKTISAITKGIPVPDEDEAETLLEDQTDMKQMANDFDELINSFSNSEKEAFNLENEDLLKEFQSFMDKKDEEVEEEEEDKQLSVVLIDKSKQENTPKVVLMEDRPDRQPSTRLLRHGIAAEYNLPG